MKVAIISKQKTDDIKSLQKIFQDKKFEKVQFIKESNLGLITSGKETKILAGSTNLGAFDAVYLRADPELTPFVEPFLDELAEKGIYCQVKPDCFYNTSNKALMYNILNSKGIPISRTIAFQDASIINQLSDDLVYPVIFKSFAGYEKIQSLVVDSVKNLNAVSKGIKTDVDLVLVQEYQEGDLVYALVIGEEVFATTRKWDEKKQEHGKRELNVSISEKDAKMARRAATLVGTDIATVKMINGKVMNVLPQLNWARFNPALGKHLEHNIVQMYVQKLKGGLE